MHLIRSESGVSLFSVMMLASIIGTLSVVVMTMNKNMNKESKTAQKNIDIDNVMNEIRTALNNKETCSITVFGAHPSLDTVLSGIKELDTSGSVVPHSKLVVSTVSSPRYLAPGLIINGMFLKYVPDDPPKVPVINGRHFDLIITFMKSTKAASSAIAADTFYGSNIISRRIATSTHIKPEYISTNN